MKRWLLITGYWLLIISIQLLITNYQLPTHPSFGGGQQVFAQSIMEGFRLKKMEGINVKWELEADSARFEDDFKKLKGIKVKFYPDDKDPFTIKAEDGLVKENIPISDSAEDKKDEIYLENNVRVIGYLSSEIRCKTLNWDSASEIMHTQDKIEIEAEKWHIRGEDAEIFPSKDTITINKNVTMEIN